MTSSMPRPKVSAVVIKRPSLETRFHIDYDWWDKSHLDLKTYLLTSLGVGKNLTLEQTMEEVDLVDPQTGEVRRVDGFQYMLQSYFRQLPEDFLTHTSLVDAAFCVLLANANQPMTAQEIASHVHRPPDVVLKTLGGPQIYQGIRPLPEE